MDARRVVFVSGLIKKSKLYKMSRTINYYNVSADPSQVTAPVVDSADDDEINPDAESGMFANVSLMYVSTVIFTTGIIFFIMATFVKQITRRKSMLVLAGQIFASLSFGVLITNFLEVGADYRCDNWCHKGRNKHKSWICTKKGCAACNFCRWPKHKGKSKYFYPPTAKAAKPGCQHGYYFDEQEGRCKSKYDKHQADLEKAKDADAAGTAAAALEREEEIIRRYEAKKQAEKDEIERQKRENKRKHDCFNDKLNAYNEYESNYKYYVTDTWRLTNTKNRQNFKNKYGTTKIKFSDWTDYRGYSNCGIQSWTGPGGSKARNPFCTSALPCP